VASSNKTDCRQLSASQQSTKDSDSCAQTAEKAPIPENKIVSFSYIRSALNDQGVPIKAQELIIQSWRSSTRKHYAIYIRQWIHFCEGKGNPFNPNLNMFFAIFIIAL